MSASPERKRAVFIVGTTASGKTALSIALAKRLNGEIISADSMQIYRGMDVGTAKPSAAERDGVPHHMLDIADPSDCYSAERFVSEAGQALTDVCSRGKLPIVVGGTGFYVNSLINGSVFPPQPEDSALRDELRLFAAEHGNAALHGLLSELDPEAAARIHENNVRRVVRAIEINRLSGCRVSEFAASVAPAAPAIDALLLGLTIEPRELLYKRIDERVDRMMEQGLLTEVRMLKSRGISPDSTAMQAIGYKELYGALNGEMSPEDAAELIKRRTRNYAKRQLTWFRADKRVVWLPQPPESEAEKTVSAFLGC